MTGAIGRIPFYAKNSAYTHQLIFGWGGITSS